MSSIKNLAKCNNTCNIACYNHKIDFALAKRIDNLPNEIYVAMINVKGVTNMSKVTLSNIEKIHCILAEKLCEVK